MDAKLKALRVADLKEILSKASVAPGNAKKQDLINKILANQAAIDVFHALHPPKNPVPAPAAPSDDLLAPPEEVDWTVQDATHVLSPSTDLVVDTDLVHAPPSKSKQPPASPDKPLPCASALPVPAPPVPEAILVLDDEEAKRKARAARFNIAYVEPNKTRSSLHHEKNTAATQEDLDKLRARSLRFGASSGKRQARVEQVDPEEQERRRKRAERFGLPTAAPA